MTRLSRWFVACLLAANCAVADEQTPTPPPQEITALNAAVATDDRASVIDLLEKWSKQAAVLENGLWDLWSAAQIARRSGRHDRALTFLDILDEYATRTAGESGIATYSQIERLQIALDLGNLDDASIELKKLRESVARIPESSGNLWYARVDTATLEIEYCLSADDFDGACQHAERLLEGPLSDRRDARRWMRARTKFDLAMLGRARRDPKLVRAAVNQLDESFRDPLYADPDLSTTDERIRIGTTLTGLRLRLGEVEEASALIREMTALRTDESPLSIGSQVWLEAVELRTALARNDSRDAIEEVMRRLERSFDAAIQATTQLTDGTASGYLHYSHMIEALGDLISAALVLGGPERAFEVVLHTERHAHLNHRLGLATPSVAQLCGEVLVSERHALLSCIPSPEGSHVFLVTKAGVEHFARPDTASLKGAWKRLESYLQRPLDPTDHSRAQAIANEVAPILLGDEVLARLPGFDSLTIHALAAFADFSLENLVIGGRFLGESHAIAHAPTLALALQLARRAPAIEPLERIGTPAVLELAAPATSPLLEARFSSVRLLGFSDSALDAMTRPYGSGYVATLRSDAATVAALLSTTPGRVLAIFAHGVWVGGRERGAAIALAPSASDLVPELPGLLFAEQIETLRAPWLVTLGVCGAGLGPRRFGNESALDLGGAFLLAGAGAVVLSSSRVEAESTRRELVAFHAAVATGTSPAEALRRARIAVARADLKDGTTFLDSFRVVGAGHHALFPQREPHPEEAPAHERSLARSFLLAGAGLCVLLAALRAVSDRWNRRHPGAE